MEIFEEQCVPARWQPALSRDDLGYAESSYVHIVSLLSSMQLGLWRLKYCDSLSKQIADYNYLF